MWEHNQNLQHLSVDDLYSLLSDDYLVARNEDNVLVFLIKWISLDENSRGPHLPQLMKAARLGLCSIKYLQYLMRKKFIVKRHASVMSQLKDVIELKCQQSDPRLDQTLLDNPHWFKHRVPPFGILVLGGWMRSGITNRIEIFNPNSNKWSTGNYQDAGHQRAYHGVVRLGNHVYSLGGYNGLQCLSTVRRFDIEQRAWSEVACMHICRCYAAFTSVWDCNIIAAGGYTGHSRTNSCEMYDCHTNTWTTIAPMREKRSDASAAFTNRMAFVAGGYNGVDVLSSVEVYRAEEDSWTDVQPLTEPRSGFHLLGYKKTIIAIGGFNGTRRLRSVEEYDVNTDSWIHVTNMQIPRSNFLAVLVDGELYAIGGYFSGNMTESSAEKINWKGCLRQTSSWHFVPGLVGARSALAGCDLEGPAVTTLQQDEA